MPSTTQYPSSVIYHYNGFENLFHSAYVETIIEWRNGIREWHADPVTNARDCRLRLSVLDKHLDDFERCMNLPEVN